MTQTTPAGWHPDPTQRHEYRYWDGTRWSDHVSDHGAVAVDPVVPTATDIPTDANPAPAAGDTAPTPTAAAAPAPAAAAGPTPPLKLCPHCQASSATYAAICPACGGRYTGRAKWPWIVAALFVLMLVGIGACAVIVSRVADRAITELNREQARHAITRAQFDAVALGSTRARVIGQLGRPPEDFQEFLSRGILDQSAVNSACIYYNRVGASFGDRFQFCFENNRLISKNSY